MATNRMPTRVANLRVPVVMLIPLNKTLCGHEAITGAP